MIQVTSGTAENSYHPPRVIFCVSKENLSMKARIALVSIALLAAAAGNTALAMDQGDWLVRFGVSNVDPKSNNHPAVSVDSGTGPRRQLWGWK